MRLRDQVIVVIAVTVATIAVAANVFAYTQAVERRAESDRIAVTRNWAQPIMPSRNEQPPANVENPVADSPAVSDPTTGPGQLPAPDPDTANDSAKPCSDTEPCTIEEVLGHDYRNHGQMVSAYVEALGFEEGLDGPRGSFVRQIAKPSIDEDGPPRSDRAVENQDKDKDTPPGQDKDTPPGQDKDKDKDD